MLLGGSGGIIAAAIATILGADMFQTFIGVLSGAFIMTISSILIGSVLSILFRWIGEGFSETPFAIVVAGIGGGFLAVGAVRLAVPLLYQEVLKRGQLRPSYCYYYWCIRWIGCCRSQDYTLL